MNTPFFTSTQHLDLLKMLGKVKNILATGGLMFNDDFPWKNP